MGWTKAWTGIGLAAALALAQSGGALAGECRMAQHAELKVEPGGARPILQGDAGGKPVRALVDTGAWATSLTADGAARLGLRVKGSEAQTYGVGGATQTGSTTIPALHFASLTAKDMTLPVSGSGLGVDMLLGDDVFNKYDVELDLPHGFIRLLTITGCSDDQVPYWGKGAYVLVPLVGRSEGPSPYVVTVRLNSHPVDAIIDTGADSSLATPGVVRVAGGRNEAAGAGRVVGVAARPIPTSLARFDTFTIGDETIRNPSLPIADIYSGAASVSLGSRIGAPVEAPSMLLGADFLRAHRVVLSRSRGKAYITYEGGPIFAPAPAAAAATKGVAAGPPAR